MISCAFPKALRIRTRKQYQRLAYKGNRCFGRYVIIEFCKSLHAPTRLGITVSRKYGKAHDRNRFKRTVREAFRTCRHLLPFHVDLNVKPRGFHKHLKVQDVQNEMLLLLQSVEL